MSKLVTLQQLKTGMQAVKDYINGLFIATAEAIEEVEAAKADKSKAITVTIPVEGWTEDATIPEFPLAYDIPVEGITAYDMATITVAPESIGTAVACKLCPTNETIAGKIRVRAVSVPASSITAEYWIEQGKE